MTGVRLGRRLVVTHLLVVAVSLLVLAAGAAAGLPTPAAVALAVGVGTLLGAVLALRTARWISGPLQEVGGALFTSLSGRGPQHLEEPPGDTPHPEEDTRRPEGHLVASGRPKGHLRETRRLEGRLGPVLDNRAPAEVRRLAGALEQVGAELTGRLAELNRESGLREQILSSMSEGVVLADASGRILYANPAAEGLLPGALTLPSQLRTEGPVELTLRHPRRRDLKATCLRLGDGRRLVAIQDVTEAKRIEAMRRDFVADASHEMKTPIASIQAVAETLEMAVLDDPDAVPRFMSTLLLEIRRLSALVQDLLDLARLEGRPPERSAVSLTRVVEQEAARVHPEADEKRLSVREEIALGVMVAGSPEDLSLALRNLLDNALRYTQEGEVSVRLWVEDGHAKVEVADTGPGIPGKDLSRIFERFYRVDRARSRETGGTGLGLSIVRHVVEQHNGWVQVESELGRGSRFVLTMPVLRGAPAGE
ncbi:MAG TPA: ATP-binding protein [Actinomycetota bacterium]|nr:ATP-binding protein [Actinomycetota bacterium]